MNEPTRRQCLVTCGIVVSGGTGCLKSQTGSAGTPEQNADAPGTTDATETADPTETPGIESPELDVTFSTDIVDLDGVEDDPVTVEATVVTERGQRVDGGKVLVTAGSVELSDRPLVGETTDGTATFTFDGSHVRFRSDQEKGTLTVEIVPPRDSPTVDREGNRDLIVVNDGQ